MSEKFTVEIISPENSIIKTSTSEVIIPSFEGEMGILKDHIPLITFLRPGIIKITGEKDKKLDGWHFLFQQLLQVLQEVCMLLIMNILVLSLSV